MIGARTRLLYRLYKLRRAEQRQERLNGTVFVGRKPHRSLRALTKPIRATYEIAPLDEKQIAEELYPEVK